MAPRPQQTKKPIIGLAGGIGAGKSSVATLLKSLGAYVIDSDQMAHRELRDPDVVAELQDWWGQDICNAAGEIDRRKIAGMVFQFPNELRRLEELLYPRLKQQHDIIIKELYDQPLVRAIVIDAPMLFEAGVDQECDAVWFVEAPYERRLQRVKHSRNWDEKEMLRRENLQIPLDTKRLKADHIIHNDSDKDHLLEQVKGLFASVLESFA